MAADRLVPVRFEILPLDQDGLLPLLRESYGLAYFGDERMKHIFNLVTRSMGLVDDLGSIASAAMLKRERIISVATSTNRAKFGARRDLMLGLLNGCREDGHGQWISIAESHTKMFDITESAGMERFTDIDQLEDILASAKQEHQYTITDDSHRQPVLVTNNGPGTGNRQQVWGWNDWQSGQSSAAGL
jgi:hypothetical protein